MFIVSLFAQINSSLGKEAKRKVNCSIAPFLAGVGHWASSYIQISQPQYFEGNSYLSDDTLDQMIALLAVLFTSIKGRREMLREHCPPHSSRTGNDGRTGSNPWVVLDSDGEDENNDDVFPLRENDYVGKFVRLAPNLTHPF